jgi:hypothetical protein
MKDTHNNSVLCEIELILKKSMGCLSLEDFVSSLPACDTGVSISSRQEPPLETSESIENPVGSTNNRSFSHEHEFSHVLNTDRFKHSVFTSVVATVQEDCALLGKLRTLSGCGDREDREHAVIVSFYGINALKGDVCKIVEAARTECLQLKHHTSQQTIKRKRTRDGDLSSIDLPIHPKNGEVTVAKIPRKIISSHETLFRNSHCDYIMFELVLSNEKRISLMTELHD